MILRWHCFAAVVFLLGLTLSGLWISGLEVRRQADEALLEARRQLVAGLQLTDFAIWTEARYTRHPSQADFFTPFQDYPGSLEHFPAGSLLAPPAPYPVTRLQVDRKGHP